MAMRTMKRIGSKFTRTTALATALVLALAVAAVVAKSGPSGGGESASVLGNEVLKGVSTPAAAPDPETPGTFGISGSVAGLYPGATRPLELKVSNPQRFAIRVKTITVSVADVNGACRGTALSVSQLAAPFRIPRHQTRKATLQVTMRPGAPRNCAGKTWNLTFGGTAVKA